MRFFLLFFCLWPVSLVAQLKGWQELTISDGLSQGMVFDLKQDQKGFIWVATKDGLNRYDGYNFTAFTHDPYNPYSLSSNACSALLVDSRGRLWIGTLNQGLNLYDDRTQRFYHIDMSDPTSAEAGNYEVILLSEDPEGNIWVGTSQNKLVKITLMGSLKTGFPSQTSATSQVRFSRFSFPLPGAASSSAPSHVLFRANGQAIVSAAGGMYTLNWQHPTGVTLFTRFGPKASPFCAASEGPPPDYWFGYRPNALTCWRQADYKSIALPPLENQNVYLNTLDANTIAVATPTFLWLMSPAQLYGQDSLSARNAFAVMPPGLYGITRLLIDRTGNIWVGTAGYGLRKFSPRIKRFQTYLPNLSLSYMCQDRRRQLYLRDQFTYQRLDRSANRRVPFLAKNSPIANGLPGYLMQDRQGFFWLSISYFDAQQYLLVKFSEDWKQLKAYPLPPGISFGSYGNQTREDKAGQLWIGARNGKLLRFNPVTETFQVFSYQALLPKRGADIDTYALYFDQAGTLWIGTQNGLIRADHPQATPAFSIYKNDVANRKSLSNDFVSDVVEDPYRPANYLWVSTKGGGLERLNRQTNQFDHFTETSGLPNKVVYGILVDEFKNLWMGTNRGLAKFNPKTLTFRNYVKGDGLQDDEFNTGSQLKTAAGELLFGGVNGLTTFRPEDMTGDVGPVAPVHITGLKINNKSIATGASDNILPESIELTQQLDLAHTQNGLTIEFALMDYTNAAKNQYRYRLRGIDRNWVESGTNRFANYAQLPDGTYQFAVQGSADGDSWSKPVELAIRIHPPFYRSWWAYMLYALGLAVIGWLLYRFQTQRLLLQQQVAFEQKEASRLAELDGLKTQFFTNISHEFRTPLTLILGPLTDLKKRFLNEKMVSLTEPVVTLMEQNSHRLLSLINQLLDLSKLEAGQLKPEPKLGNLATFFRTLAGSFSSLAQSRQIQFTFTLAMAEGWANFDQDKIEKIVTNLLANAFKFTPAGNQVSLTVDYTASGTAGLLTFTVADTGIGIAPANLTTIFERFYQVDGTSNRTYEGTGIGLSLVNELVNVLGGTITVASTEGVGTSFTVKLPLVVVEQELVVETSESAGQPQPTPAAPAIATQSAHEAATPLLATDKIILVIDDNADIRAYIRSIFESEYHILEAGDGQIGLEEATSVLPDLVICDLMMPRLDGFGFCKALKSQEATSHIPVIMLTAKATVEDRIEGFELGADEYLTKPFNQAELRARTRNLLVKQLRLQQHYKSGVLLTEAPVNAPARPAREEAFLSKARAVVTAQLGESQFGVEEFSQQMGMSQSQLVRKLKALTGQTAVEYVRNYRLDVAAERLRRGETNVSEIAYEVGFESLSYFTRVFQERLGVLPSTLIPTGPTHGPVSNTTPS